ncbi:pantoate--beta-alanine ligase [Andreprevotia lacus DSM 23236]|jgi:pantoate--beta-alanine ligase|uniref:Pantothenate synthetase n=1 Tax=Andreprevotia lacus DSM 23236 TaxID=1121001 RepID=A0A1W1XXF0_9NEIS|nr:pantoate--beta-alanine ligase [Andreprevotia lacus]SMC28545.1 pantoate--beta-alanine ligase [Andreprevotia lacus DSM 23236]
MQIIHTISELRAWRKTAGRVAFVPTMGNLHAGHMALIREARQHADRVVVSIFVNRLQFGQGEDFDRYPRTLEQDAQLIAAECPEAVVFAPDERELYPHVIQQYKVEPPAIQDELCGAFRPGHFRGVATVVTKLFNCVQPDVACFGKKDYQQLFVIQSMVEELNMPITIIPVDTGRAADGLALSSRNGYLSEAERAEAPRIYHHLTRMRDAILAGERDFARLADETIADLKQRGWGDVDYVETRNARTLKPAVHTDHELVILVAARLGKTRLIDNLEVRC